MREIKFRGKNTGNNQMIFGCLVNNMWTYSEHSGFKKGTKVCEIFTGEFGSDNWLDAIEEDNFIFSVYPYSVGQFTGLKDKNGTDIYEGDIIEHGIAKCVSIVIFKDGSFCLTHKKNKSHSYLKHYCIEECKVIGNIHENPELL